MLKYELGEKLDTKVLKDTKAVVEMLDKGTNPMQKSINIALAKMKD